MITSNRQKSPRRNRTSSYDSIITLLVANKTYVAHIPTWKAMNYSVPSFKVALYRRLKDTNLKHVYRCKIKYEEVSIVFSLVEKIHYE